MPAELYVQVSLALTSAILSAIFLMAWRTQGKKDHALTWSIAFLFGALHWATNIIASHSPTDNINQLIASGFMLTATTLALLGHCQRTDAMNGRLALLFSASIVFAAIAYFTVAAEHAGWRVGLAPLYAAMTLFGSSWLVLSYRLQPRPAEWGTGIALIVFATMQLTAAVYGFLQGAEPNMHYFAIYTQLTHTALPSAFIGTGMFVLFMLASDLTDQMQEIAVRDQLTGMLNRRGFSDAAAAAYASARRSNRPVSVIMTDVDRFKSINDMYGHMTGDLALRHFAAVLAHGRRTEDVLARIGGEEFALVLPGTDVEASIKIANELCERLASSPMKSDLEPLTMTASFGVATISVNDTCLTDVIIRADAALYRSKRSGRNRVDLESSQLMLKPSGELAPIK